MTFASATAGPGVGHGVAFDGNGISRYDGLGLLQLHFEAGAFVFFYFEGEVAVFGLDTKITGQATGGQGKIRVEAAEFIGSHLLLGYLLVCWRRAG